MALQDTFINSVLGCQNAGFAWPAITAPGLPNMMLATFGASMAGINYVLQYLPPSANNLPSLPSVAIFLNAFMASVNIPSPYPAFSFGPISIPGVPGTPTYDVSGQFKMIYVMVMLPFQVISSIITGIINNLAVAIPSASTILNIALSLAANIGISATSFISLLGCVATALFNLLTATL